MYAIDMKGLADIMARLLTMTSGGKPGPDYIDKYHDFFNPPEFKAEYPFGLIKFLQAPASWNTRMIRQMGSFLYDTFDFNLSGFKDLEDLIEKTKETPDTAGNVVPTLYKVSLPLTEGPSVFNELDVAGMTGTRLLDDYEGAVADAKNAYNYNRKSGYFWNLAASGKAGS